MSLNKNNQLNPAEDDESALFRHESVSPPTQSSANPRRTLIDDISMFNFLGPQFCLPRNNPVGQDPTKTVPEIIYSQPIHNNRPKLVEPVNGNFENVPNGTIPNPRPRSKLPGTSSTPNGSTGFDSTVTVPTPPPRTKLPGTSKINDELFDLAKPVPIPTLRNTFPSSSSDEMTTNFELLASGIDTRKASSDPTIREMLDMGCTVQELIANGVTRNEITRSGIDAHSSRNSDDEDLTAVTKIYGEIQEICEAQASSFDLGQMSESIYETIPDQEPTGCQGLILWQENDKNPPEVCWATIESSKLIVCQHSDRRHILTMDGLKSLISVGDPLEDVVDPPNKNRFEIVVAGWQTSGRTLITPSQAERRTWQQWILRASTCPFDSNLTESFTRAGTVFIKENVSGEWRRSWILLNMEQKTLHRQYLDARAQTISEVFVADLRKIRSISLIFNSGLEHEFGHKATGTCVVLTWSGFALYIESIVKVGI